MHSVNITNSKISSTTHLLSITGQWYEFQALWGTGATDTCISQALVNQLGLVQITNSHTKTVTLGNGNTGVGIPYLIVMRLPGIAQGFTVTAYLIPGLPVDLNIGMNVILIGTVTIQNNVFSFDYP